MPRTLIVLLMALVTLMGCSESPKTSRSPENDALIRAAREGHDDTVKALLASGAGVNAKDEQGNTALIEAARYGHDDVVRALLAGGASIQAKDKEGKTALMLAAQGGHTEIVQLLKQAGAAE